MDILRFQSTHPVRGATATDLLMSRRIGISIHAPREGCDAITRTKRHSTIQFQSTHPVRGATSISVIQQIVLQISIHAPREGCDVARHRIEMHPVISIHAPREGCDTARTRDQTVANAFQSTHPVRGATARMDFISQNMDTPPIPRHQLYRTIHPHFPRYANPLNRYASRSLTLELSNDKKNTHRPQKP